MPSDTKKIISKCISFVTSRFKQTYASFLTGSAAENQTTNFSDIDIIIISNNQDYSRSEIFIHEKKEFQVTIFPLQQIHQILWHDYSNGTGIILGMFSKAILLTDTKEFGKELIKKCNRVYNLIPPPHSHQEIIQLISIITNNIHDLKGFDLFESALFTLNETIALLSQLYHKNDRLWCTNGKHLTNSLMKNFPSFFSEVQYVLKNTYTEKNLSNFISFAEKNIEKFQVKSKIKTTDLGLLESTKDYLIIQLQYTQSNFAKNFAEIFPSFDYIQIRTSPLGSNNLVTESIYIIFFNLLKQSKHKLVNSLHETVTTKKMIIGRDIQFPVNLNLEIFLQAERKNFKCCLEILSKVSTLYQKHFFSKNELAISLLIFNLIVEALIPSRYIYPFINSLFEDWFVLSYDNGRLWTIEQLLFSKSQKLRTYETHFQANNEILRRYKNRNMNNMKANLAIDKYLQTIKNSTYSKKDINFLPSPKVEFETKISSSYAYTVKKLCFLTLGCLNISEENRSFIAFFSKNLLTRHSS